VRDCDLALALLPKSKLAESSAFRASLGRQRKDAERMLLSTLNRWMQRKSSLKWRIKLQGAFAAKKKFPEIAQELAAELLPALAKEFFERGKRVAQAEGSAEDLHQFLRAAKKLRYTLELFVTLYGHDLGEWLEQIRSIHALAGRVDDFAAVRKMVARDANDEALDSALGKKHRKQIEILRDEWIDKFVSPDRARHWIHYLHDFPGRSEAPKKPMARSASASNAPIQRSQHA
jgi:CHAD domain-containing protein